MSYWAEYKVVGELQATLDHIVDADEKPAGNWWGPFHCFDCAESCANFSMSEAQAYAFHHGTEDEAFCATLGVT
jgi:hypothetical protein